MEKKSHSFDFLKFYNGTYDSLEKLLPLEVTLDYMNEFFNNVHKIESDKDMYNDLKTFEAEKDRYSNVSLKVKLIYFSVHLCHCFLKNDKIKSFVPRQKLPYVWLDFDAKEGVKMLKNEANNSVDVILHTVRSVRDMKTSEFHFKRNSKDTLCFQFALRKDQNNRVNFIRGDKQQQKDLILLLTFELKYIGCYLNSTLEELTCNFHE
jgi:hypothetical protein